MVRRTYVKRYSSVAVFGAGVLLMLVATSLWRVPLAVAVWRTTHVALLAAAISGDDAPLLFEIGNCYFNGGDYDLGAAVIYFEKSLESNPNIPLAHYQIARIRFLRGDYVGARAEINKEIELHPEIPNSYYVRGLINGYAGEYAAAVSDFTKFNSLVPTVWAGRNDLAWIYFKLGQYEDAERAARAGLLIKPDNPWLRISHGVALLNLGRKEEARKDFLMARSEAAILTPEKWGTAYPGNSPDYYAKGLTAMQEAIESNLKLTE